MSTNQIITATFDGQVFKPENPLNLETNKQYKIQLIIDDEQENKDNNQESNLTQLHEEFDWLIADLGVKKPLTRETAYDN